MKFALVFLTLAALVSATPVDLDERDALALDVDVAERDPIGLASFELDERDAEAFDDDDLMARDAEAEAEFEELVARREGTGYANPPKGKGLKCREGPTSSNKRLKTYGKGHVLKIKCQTTGQSVRGNTIWNKINVRLAKDCYVPDAYTRTGHKRIPGVPLC